MYLLCATDSLARAVHPCREVPRSVTSFCFRIKVFNSGSKSRPARSANSDVISYQTIESIVSCVSLCHLQFVAATVPHGDGRKHGSGGNQVACMMRE